MLGNRAKRAATRDVVRSLRTVDSGKSDMWGLEGGKNPGVAMTIQAPDIGGEGGQGRDDREGRKVSQLQPGQRVTSPGLVAGGKCPSGESRGPCEFCRVPAGDALPPTNDNARESYPPRALRRWSAVAYRLAFTSWRSFHRATIRTLRGLPATRGLLVS